MAIETGGRGIRDVKWNTYRKDGKLEDSSRDKDRK